MSAIGQYEDHQTCATEPGQNSDHGGFAAHSVTLLDAAKTPVDVQGGLPETGNPPGRLVPNSEIDYDPKLYPI
jgi:hypothetical protein